MKLTMADALDPCCVCRAASQSRPAASSNDQVKLRNCAGQANAGHPNRSLFQTTVPMFFGGTQPRRVIGAVGDPSPFPINDEDVYSTQDAPPNSLRTKRGVVGFNESGRLSHGSSLTLAEAVSISLIEIAANYLTHTVEPCGKNTDKCSVSLSHTGPFGKGSITNQFVAYNLSHKISELRKFEPVRAFCIQRQWGLQLVGIEKLSPEDGSRKLLK